jgi:hypothetical protein
MADPVVLKDLLRQRHWQTYRTFCSQYDKAAKTIDSALVGSYPSRAQLHRWQSGDLKGLPYPHHCQVLEAMFPGLTAAQMFEPIREQQPADGADGAHSMDGLLATIKARLNAPASPNRGWSREALPAERSGLATAPSFPLGLGQMSKDESRDGLAEHIARSVVMLGKRMRLAENEVVQLGGLVGNLVDLEMECSIDIDAEGWSSVSYRFEVLNLTNRPVKRMLREQWFETTNGLLKIEPSESSDRSVQIQRMHDTANMTKFACQFSPAIEPGEVGVIAYITRGGRFTHDHYWRQTTTRPVRHFTLNICHRGVDMLLGCTAIEDQTDGSQISAIDDLVCTTDYDGSALMTITRDYLQAGQAITLRWEVGHATS